MNHFKAHHETPAVAVNMVAYQYALFNCLQGVELEERGQKYKTWDAATIHFDSNQSILFNFEDRKLNARYAVEEFLWYVRGNKYDDEIEKHATLWKKLKQEDGSFFSNYGQYIFNHQTPDGISAFRFAFEQLRRNSGTRRAAIPLLKTAHCFHDNTDMVCTFAIQFFIRQGYLNMIVNMRSNDAVWGLTNDAFAFSMIHRLMFRALQVGGMPGLRLGVYTHMANTLHVYERHYEMAQRIADSDVRDVKLIDVPMFDEDDTMEMLARPGGCTTETMRWTKFLDLSTG